jgi:murein DD-endopeptidase MepM/ murein hydrolase activator NlpD
MRKPIEDGYITSGYGNRVINGVTQFHPGLDISTKNEVPQIVSVFKCKVTTCGFSNSFGNRVWAKILEGDYVGLYVAYAHMKSIEEGIEVGDILEEGDKIGIMGNTGWSEGAHLHFELRTLPNMNGISKNPTEIHDLYVDNSLTDRE